MEETAEHLKHLRLEARPTLDLDDPHDSD